MQHAPRSFLRVGVIAALVALALDQASKVWLLSVFGIASRGAVHLTPFFDLALTWNKGISYGWFQTDSTGGELILLGVKILAVIGLAIWLTPVHSTLPPVGLGLVLGGGRAHAPHPLSPFGGVGFS